MNRFLLALVMVLLTASAALAGEVSKVSIDDRIRKLEKALVSQGELIRQQGEVIKSLKQELKGRKVAGGRHGDGIGKLLSEADKDSIVSRVLDSASKAVLGGDKRFKASQSAQSKMNPSISLNVDTFFYSTNLSDAELEGREIPGYRTLREEAGSTHAHAESEEGFNLRSAELQISAPLDPYLNLYTTIPISESGIEVEEAYFVTTSLPRGLQLKGGKFKSGFGRFNSFHRHAWNFVDAPIPYLAFFGAEGLIEKGLQMTYLPDLPIYTLLGFEVLQGDNERDKDGIYRTRE